MVISVGRPTLCRRKAVTDTEITQKLAVTHQLSEGESDMCREGAVFKDMSLRLEKELSAAFARCVASLIKRRADVLVVRNNIKDVSKR